MDFVQAMSKDPLLKSAIDSHDLAKEISLGFLEEEVRATIKDFEAASSQEGSSIKSKNNTKWYWWVIASAVLGGIAYYLFGMNNADSSNVFRQEIYASIYEAPAWPRDRGSVEDELSVAITTALDIDKDKGIALLKKINISQAEKDYWLAELFTYFGQADSTMHYLPKDYKDNIRRDRVMYLQILAQYKMGNVIRAKRLIDDLPSDTDQWYLQRYDRIAKNN